MDNFMSPKAPIKTKSCDLRSVQHDLTEADDEYNVSREDIGPVFPLVSWPCLSPIADVLGAGTI